MNSVLLVGILLRKNIHCEPVTSHTDCFAGYQLRIPKVFIKSYFHQICTKRLVSELLPSKPIFYCFWSFPLKGSRLYNFEIIWLYLVLNQFVFYACSLNKNSLLFFFFFFLAIRILLSVDFLTCVKHESGLWHSPVNDLN